MRWPGSTRRQRNSETVRITGAYNVGVAAAGDGGGGVVMGIFSRIVESFTGPLGLDDNGTFAPGGPFSDPGGDMTANREAREKAEEEDHQNQE